MIVFEGDTTVFVNADPADFDAIAESVDFF